MFYHIRLGVTAIASWIEENKSREEALTQFLCPVINREITFFENKLLNMSSLGSVRVFETTKPIDSDWPVKREDYFDKDGKFIDWKYNMALEGALENESKNVTLELYREAIVLLESGQYKEFRTKLIEQIKGTYSFFICPLDNREIEHNYEFVIKPIVRQFQFEIQKSDEISHTGTITDEILRAISRSRFIIADLTDARPNCYYEVGYAHAVGKPVIILAKEGTTRHFDISTHKWNYWADYKDLKPKLEKELFAILRDLGFKAKDDLG